MKRDKILMVGPLPPQIGGVEFFVEALLKSSLRDRFPIRHLDISKPKSRQHKQFDSPSGYARSFRRDIKLTLFSFAYSIYHFARYLCIIPRREIGIVHLHTSSYMSFWEKCLYLDLAKLLGVKVVLHVHGSSFDQFIVASKPRIRRLILSHLNRCDCVVALSETWYKFFTSYLPAAKVAQVENGIDLSIYKNLQTTPSATPLVVFLGEICARKGIYDLLPALQNVFAAIPEARARFIGPGEIDQARMKTEELGIADKIDFSGPRWGREKAELIAAGWCLVLPSYAEVMPLVILEGFAARLPVIATFVGGIPDVVQEGVNGFLVHAGDVDNLRAAILRILMDADLRQRMAASNEQAAWEHYDIGVCAGKVGDIYARLFA